jgi:hypothetical protein
MTWIAVERPSAIESSASFCLLVFCIVTLATLVRSSRLERQSGVPPTSGRAISDRLSACLA